MTQEPLLMCQGGGVAKCWIPVGNHLDEADSDEDLDHATAGGSGPGIKSELEICVSDLLAAK